ncbi:MAG TPA: DUF2062 domain-containing protein [Desulfuromonadaceae bacterium]
MKERLLSTALGRRLSIVLHSGLTPHKLALTFCCGIAIGVLPLMWGTTILCVVCGHCFRLNHVALQTVNYLVYPLQIALFVPLCLMGSKLFPWGPSIPPEILPTLLHGHLAASMHLLVWITLKAIGAWLITAAPLAVSLYPPLLMLFRRRFAPTAG